MSPLKRSTKKKAVPADSMARASSRAAAGASGSGTGSAAAGAENGGRRDKSALLDAADRRLIELLAADGRAGNRWLAGEIGLTEATVASRIRRLADASVLGVTAVLDWEVAGYQWYVICFITVEGRTPRAVATEVADLPGAQAATMVFGQSDIVAMFMVADRAELRRLVGEDLPGVPGVRRVEASLLTDVIGWDWNVATFPVVRQPQLHFPAPPFPLDEIDLGLITAVVADGRQSNREIARQLGVSDGTIRARLRRMEEAGLLRIVALTDPVALGTVGSFAFLCIDVEGPLAAPIARKMAGLPEVRTCVTTMGRQDIFAVVACQTQADLIELVAERMRSIDGIRSTETIEAIEVVKHVYHWVRIL